MSDPDTAGLDTIFWLHHANIDRLWEVWRENQTPTDLDPSQSNWISGPAAVGDRAFKLPMPGGVSWTYTPGDLNDLSKLNYNYDDVSPPSGTPQLTARMRRLRPNLTAAADIRSTAMAKKVELLGANAGSLRLSGAEARTSVKLDTSVQRKVSASLTAAAPSVPDRIFLNLENVRGANDATTFSVYINVPDDRADSSG